MVDDESVVFYCLVRRLDLYGDSVHDFFSFFYLIRFGIVQDYSMIMFICLFCSNYQVGEGLVPHTMTYDRGLRGG